MLFIGSNLVTLLLGDMRMIENSYDLVKPNQPGTATR